MAYLYILQNQDGRYYIGITTLLPDARLNRHNKGYVQSTKRFRPWTLVRTEGFSSMVEARQREKQIKSWKSGNAFKKLIGKAAGSSNGRTPGFGPGYDGSSPSPAALPKKKK